MIVINLFGLGYMVQNIVKNNDKSLFRHEETQNFYNSIDGVSIRPPPSNSDIFINIKNAFQNVYKKIFHDDSNQVTEDIKPPFSRK